MFKLRMGDRRKNESFVPNDYSERRCLVDRRRFEVLETSFDAFQALMSIVWHHESSKNVKDNQFK